jgi:NAD(P)-dependent dehydrogenase (short-subunit alcohol dehydrogenase family)
MKDFKSKVAVVTGAASGIGRAMADRFATEGMKVVLADIEEEALANAEDEMNAKGATALAVPTDVSMAGEVEALADKTINAFGAVHILCNNAGVAVYGKSWERPLKDWQWVLGVNLWALIHGIRTFVPIMLAQQSEGHIVNTASVAGLTSTPLNSAYQVTKHGVVTLSEALHHEFALTGAKVKVSVLCPAWVNTRIMDSVRNRPTELWNEPTWETGSPQTEAVEQGFRRAVAAGLTPQQVADQVFDAIRDEKFYIITHPEFKDAVRTRMQEILDERNPTFHFA